MDRLGFLRVRLKQWRRRLAEPEMTQREHWGSRFGFIMATAGFAVGLGNIWRFPYVVGQNGGAAFLMVYLAFAILIGIPLLTAEISIGRKAQLSPIAGMARVVGRRSPWMVFVWLGVGTTFVESSPFLVETLHGP